MQNRLHARQHASTRRDLVVPAGYGLGRHGWVALDIGTDVSEEKWSQLEEWIYTSFTLVAPKRLARIVLDADEERP
ncbi:hypothetical protein N806_04725 [Rhodococcus sp. P27]|nr:hypothetical protein N806_04725 [Rhodococcus sp. P27]